MTTEIGDLIRSRRTIGSFRKEVPSAEIVEAAIEIASWAPNHKKTEPWRVYWLGPKTAHAVVELNSDMIAQKKGAIEADVKRKSWSSVPGWLTVTCLRSDDSFREEEDYAACCCFVQNLMLALWSNGVGTKWTTGDVTRDPEFFRLLGVDANSERIVGLVWYGFPGVIPDQNRKPAETFLRRLD